MARRPSLEDCENVSKKIKSECDGLAVEGQDHESLSPSKPDESKRTDEEEATVEKVKSQGEVDLSDEVYSYTRRGFTSELFKVEINNLPKFTSVTDLKKLFKNKIDIEVKPLKLKVIRSDKGKAMYGFATFQNEEERNLVIEKLNGIKYKSSQLRVFKAKPKKGKRKSSRFPISIADIFSLPSPRSVHSTKARATAGKSSVRFMK